MKYAARMKNHRSDRMPLSLSVFLSLLIILFCLLGMTKPVMADTGPKPTLDIYLENAPSGDYYVALISEEGVKHFAEDSKARCVKEGKIPQDIVDFLFAYNVNGYTLFCEPVGDDIIYSGKAVENRFHFYYMVPRTFKVIVVTSDMEVFISPVITRLNFYSECVYDVNAGTIQEKAYEFKNFTGFLYVAGFCLLATLFVEWIVLCCFRLMRGKNFLHFLLINLLTQILLNLGLLGMNQLRLSAVWFMVLWLILEILIIVIEALYYRNKLKNKDDEIKRVRNIAYAITANIISILIEIPLLLLLSLVVFL